MLTMTSRAKTAFLEACERAEHGRLRLITPEGDVHDFGPGGEPEAELVLRDWSVVTAMASRGDIGLGETYVAGLWHSECIESLASFALLNADSLQRFHGGDAFARLKYRFADRLLRGGSLASAARNIRQHYDVGNEFFQLWLDPTMTYSGAIFTPDDEDLTRAQHRKYDRVLDRLGPAEKVLELGCGWGGFAERAADRGMHVTGVTISPSQKGYADARLDGRARIELQDYRQTEGRWPAIASIEMVEAIGERNWPTYFAVLKQRLAEGGSALIQAITVRDDHFASYRGGSDFIRRYTFPGGMLPSNASIRKAASEVGLRIADSFAFGQDYARTCRIWADEMEAKAGRARAFGFSEPFLRSWQYYLRSCAAAFATGRCNVGQIELRHDVPNDPRKEVFS